MTTLLLGRLALPYTRFFGWRFEFKRNDCLSGSFPNEYVRVFEQFLHLRKRVFGGRAKACLLYTSDAADE